MHETQFDVVINEEEQYSIWEKGTEPPSGWRTVGFSGTEEECIRHIDVVWTDMRPATLRRWFAAQHG
ncbi:MbtH family protein (plasmid) [Glutamicibacter sp. FR1]|uniref:MbtH family protein n=1 Tax=Glutamicibacter sp. FR1 TaxID=3393744 RepID=UPI0039AFF7DD